MNEKMELRAVSAPWHRGVELLVRKGHSIGIAVTMEAMSPGSYIEPTLTIDNTAAQTLIDDLWAAGFRPTEGAGSAGQLAATQKHLEDMRTLVFKVREERD